MNISSFYYLILLAIVAVIYWELPHKIQWIWLFCASILFYCLSADWKTLGYVVINVSTVYLSTLVFRYKSKYKKPTLVICLFVNIYMLIIFKYLQFGSTIAYLLFGIRLIVPDFAISLAISFYLLQLISYMLDAYWEIIPIEKNPVKLFLYTIYFPLMTSGPINRYSTFGVSLFAEHRFNYDRVSKGLKRITWGFFKNIVPIYYLQLITDEVFNNFSKYSGIIIIIAMCLYTVQLFMNFSGCMDIVIGSSDCLGIELEENFNEPFKAKTVQEFWQRWHITLGGFLRDYVMNPLLKTNIFIKFNKCCRKYFGKNYGKRIPVYLVMLFVWLLLGIWHGGAFKYIIGEGLWFGIIIILETTFKPFSVKFRNKFNIGTNNKIYAAFQIVRTYLLVSVGMLYFRADSFTVGNKMLLNMLNLGSIGYNNFSYFLTANLGFKPILILIISLFIICFKNRLSKLYCLFMNVKVPLFKIRIAQIPGATYILYWSWLFIIIKFMKAFSGGFVYAQF